MILTKPRNQCSFTGTKYTTAELVHIKYSVPQTFFYFGAKYNTEDIFEYALEDVQKLNPTYEK